MVNGNWAFLAYGQTPANLTSGTNQTTTTTAQWINGIGVLTLQQGQITDGWLIVKSGNNITDVTNVTGNYTVVFPCVIQLSVYGTNGNTTFTPSYRGTISLNRQHIDLISLRPNAAVVAQMNEMVGNCNADSLRGLWTASAIRAYPNYSVPILETIDCTTNRKWCNFWELGNLTQANGTTPIQVNVTANADGKHPCMWTFQNGTVADGEIAVPFGPGMHVIQGTTNYSLATTYYRGAR